MAFPVVQNTQTNSGSSVSSVVITKPTGLAVGDALVASICFYQSGSSRTFNTPAGWTEQTKKDNQDGGIAVYTKVADSSDVSASNFTFSISSVADLMAGSLSRVTEYSTFGVSESDENISPSSATSTYTTALTPTVSDNLVYMAFMGADNTYTGTPSVSGYSSTPSETFTEIADVGVKNVNLGLGLGVATANNTGVDQITSRSATFNDTLAGHEAGAIFVINGIISATGTNALLEVSPTFFTQNGSAGTTGTNTLLAVSPTFFDQSGYGNSPSQWENPSKSTTTWTNPDKP